MNITHTEQPSPYEMPGTTNTAGELARVRAVTLLLISSKVEEINHQIEQVRLEGLVALRPQPCHNDVFVGVGQRFTDAEGCPRAPRITIRMGAGAPAAYFG